MRKILLLSALLPLTLSSLAFADDEAATRGRLPDGRAFRVDAQGNQLVDYIAELELSVEQLTRQVHGLEFEVEEKQRQVERLTHSGAKEPAIAEKDLLGDTKETAQVPSEREQTFAMNAAMKQQAEQAAKDCSAQIASTQQLLEKTKFDLDVARRVQEKSREEYEDNVEKLRAQYSKLSCPKQDCTAEVTKVSSEHEKTRQELAQVQSSVQSERDAVQAERVAQQKRIQEYEGTLTQLKGEISARDEKLKTLEARIVTLSTKEAASGTILPAVSRQEPQIQAIAPVSVEVEKVKVVEEKREPAPQVAAVPADETEQVRVVQPQFVPNAMEQRASLSAAKMRAVDSLRGSMTGDIRRVRDMISTRDGLFQSFNQSGRALTFKPSQLVSSRGFTLSWVEERVRRATSVYELSPLARDIREIRSRVQEDIDLIKRLKR